MHDDPSRSHRVQGRWWMALVAVVAAITATALWRTFDAAPAPRPSPMRQTHRPTSHVVMAAPAAARDAVTIEVCGYGPVTLPPDDPDPLQQLPPSVRTGALE